MEPDGEVLLKELIRLQITFGNFLFLVSFSFKVDASSTSRYVPTRKVSLRK